MPTIRRFPPGNGPEGGTLVPRRRIPIAVGCMVLATPNEWETCATLVNTPAVWSHAGVDLVKPFDRKRLRRRPAGCVVLRFKAPRAPRTATTDRR